MDSRKSALLSQIIKQHIKTAQPIGSKLVLEKSKIDVSPATVRNDMATLEKDGYIAQPYTSAGRIPTEKGYKYYLDNFLKFPSLNNKEIKILVDTLKKYDEESLELTAKAMGRRLADLSRCTILIGFDPDHVYYTGVANLLRKPEFINPERMYDLGLVIDHLDKVMNQIFDEIDDTVIKIGENNPFDGKCSVILTPFTKGIFGILGPMRMDYEHNLSLINFIKQNV
ncbi:hypothetical protein HOE31_02460 [bacterium]|jgi:heat-inducible transcriptional repressor|nr:hypothetical protein [bacterium]MBT4121790.1 hypothetical protein [bacterium]MBT4495158.1 hypothetical protein [bacterium]MBT4763991.1 hypothetical protein [bacterium]MBT5401362.1 hypothetical protein [bacterium]